MANSVFASMVSDLKQSAITFTRKISRREYRQWKKLYTWHALQDQRYGQSFCNHFGINDFRLFYERNHQRCDQLIVREYVIKGS